MLVVRDAWVVVGQGVVSHHPILREAEAGCLLLSALLPSLVSRYLRQRMWYRGCNPLGALVTCCSLSEAKL